MRDASLRLRASLSMTNQERVDDSLYLELDSPRSGLRQAAERYSARDEAYPFGCAGRLPV
jgi:hypothetical protein